MKRLLLVLFMFSFSGLAFSEEINEQCAREAYKDRNFSNAIETCQKAIQLDKTNLKLYQALGGAYFATKEYQKAIESYQKVLELKPTNPHHIWHANHMMGKASGYLYNFQFAVESFRNAIAAEDNNLESHINLAATLRYMKHSDEAKTAYHKALEVAQANGNKEDIDFLEQEIKKYGF